MSFGGVSVPPPAILGGAVPARAFPGAAVAADRVLEVRGALTCTSPLTPADMRKVGIAELRGALPAGAKSLAPRRLAVGAFFESNADFC